jgi:hypothetical protein
MTEPSIIAWLDDEMGAAYTAEELADGGGFVPLVTLADWQRTDAARVAAEDMAAQAANGAAALIDVVNELRAQLAEAQKDAERYRWLKERSRRESRSGGWEGLYTLPHINAWDDSPYSADRGKGFHHNSLDEAIDAAIGSVTKPPSQWPHPDGFGGRLMGEG